MKPTSRLLCAGEGAFPSFQTVLRRTPMNPADDIWAKVIELMKQQGLSPTTIKTWFDDAKAVSLTEDSFTISTPNDYTQSVIKSLYIPKIEAALKELFSMDLKVVVLTEKELENTSGGQTGYPVSRHQRLYLRAICGRLLQPIRLLRRLAGGRYSGRAGLQPAVYLRRIRTGKHHLLYAPPTPSTPTTRL